MSICVLAFRSVGRQSRLSPPAIAATTAWRSTASIPQPGGLNTYGIAYYKMKPEVSLEEVGLIRQLGVEFRCGIEVGKDISIAEIEKSFDAIFIGLGLAGLSRCKIVDRADDELTLECDGNARRVQQLLGRERVRGLRQPGCVFLCEFL